MCNPSLPEHSELPQPSELTQPSQPHRFDSYVGRGDFVTKIGVGQVIKGKQASTVVISQ